MGVVVTITGLVIVNMRKIEEKGELLFFNPDPKIVGSKKEEDYFATAKRYLLNDPRELLEIMLSYEKPIPLHLL